MEQPEPIDGADETKTIILHHQPSIKMPMLWTTLSLPNLNDAAKNVQPATIISIFAMALSIGFLGIGSFLLWKVHDEDLPFYFYTCADAILFAYAFGMHNWLTAEQAKGSGSISARSVMRWIFVLTSLAFDGACFYIHGKSWSDPVTELFVSFCGGPLQVAFFALVFGVYANRCKADRLEGSENRNKRKGTSRAAILFVILVTVVVSICNTVVVVLSLNESNVWISMACLTVAIGICIFVFVAFGKCVDEDADRGIGATVSHTRSWD